MTRNGELVSTHPDLDFVWYSDYNLVTKLGSGTSILTDSRWGTSDITVGFTSNHICTGCHGTTSYSYFRVPHEVLVPDPSLPAPKPLVNALVWTSDTADNPKTQFHPEQPVRVHVVYYVCPFNTPLASYNVRRSAG